MTEQNQKGFVRNCNFALAILKCHKRRVSLSFVEILACFDFSGTRVRHYNFSVCLTKNLINFFANNRYAHSENDA